MRGHIVKRGKDSYSLKISLGKDSVSGKYKYQWFTVRGSKKDAEKKLSELLHQLDTGNYMKPGKINVADYLERWLKEYVYPNLSPRTAEGYEKIARRYFIPQFGNHNLVNLKPEHLQKFYSQELERGLSHQTVRNHHTLIHKAFQDAVVWGLLIRNVADAVKPPRLQQHEMQTWDENEVLRFLDSTKDTPYYDMFYLALFTGLRRSELLALRWRDLDIILSQIYINRSIHVLKGGKVYFRTPKSAKGKRMVALTPSTVLTLQEYRKRKEVEAILLDRPISENDLLFTDFERKPILPDTLSHAWIRLVARIDIKKIRLHDARHTHASLMLKQGIHPKIVQERLGHSSIQITLDTYSHVAPGLQAAAADSFDKAFTKNYNSHGVIEAKRV